MRLSEEIHNFTEFLVGEQIHAMELADKYDHDTLQDLCCLVLNRLPPRYVRHSVDVLYAISDEERNQLVDKIRLAINECREFLAQDRRQAPRE